MKACVDQAHIKGIEGCCPDPSSREEFNRRFPRFFRQRVHSSTQRRPDSRRPRATLDGGGIIEHHGRVMPNRFPCASDRILKFVLSSSPNPHEAHPACSQHMLLCIMFCQVTKESIIEKTYSFSKSPLTPLLQIPRNAGLPFVKGGKEGFNLLCLHNYGLISNVIHSFVPCS
jgi:hypothetical protein